MTTFTRILFYAVNGLGLGHVTRLLAIARAIRRRSPHSEIIFLTSSDAEDVVYREGFAAFKVPSKTLRSTGMIRPVTYARMVQTVTLNLLASFHPHILVVDTFPAGSIQELLPVLQWDSRKVFVYRVQRPEVAGSALVQNSLRLYDLAIIPHREDEEIYPLPEGLDRVFTGPIMIRDRTEAKSREDARHILGLPPQGKVLYLTFGGGGDAAMDAALATAVAALQPLRDVHLAVACPPLYYGTLRRSASLSPVSYYPMCELFPAFDAAISAAGYNTAMELLHHGVPTAFLPFPRQVDDQEARARQIAEAGAGLLIPSPTPEQISAAATKLLDGDTARRIGEAARALVPASGADRAAESILQLLR
ncbi:MAG: nucleotide disphospho-sugar-binding domain-containing protein [Chthonomonadales bacterium]